ncbi:MAG: T9SS type A sorting domain-containing protein [Candidatus Kapaibacterium sp.]
MIRSLLLACFFVACAAITCSSIAFSRPIPPLDTLRHNKEVVLYVGCINFDCYRDTVFGSMDEKFHYLPHAIHWGRSSFGILGDTLHHSDSNCVDHVPPYKRVAITTITYPSWDSLSGSVAFQRINADSLADMVIYMWGRVGDTLHRHDTIRPMLVFGQHGMDTLTTLNIASVNNFQMYPFFAMKLRIGTDLVEPDLRDLSSVTSYILEPVSYAIDSSKAPPIRETGTSRAVNVRVYPNPTGTLAQVESESTPPGEYSVEVVAVNGEMVSRQDVTVTSTRGLFKTLNLSDVPSGYYMIRIHTATTLVGSYPIIITR